MRRLLTMLLAWTLSACGGGTDVDGADASDSASAGDLVLGDTHLVADPPTYPSKPLPEGLVWLTNDEDPIFASPEAVRGGTFTDYLTAFPLTLRSFGPNAGSGSFIPSHRAMSFSLLDIHPNTLRFIPSLATHWAFDPDGVTVYYRLDPRARWSDGEPVTADDYVFTREFRLSEHIVDPYGVNYFTEEIVDVSKYDDHTISVTAGSASPGDELLYSTIISPTPRHFHRLDENWVADYDWRVEPVTGPYQFSALEKGRFIELTRDPDWWGNDLRYYRHRYNPDRIRFNIVRDENVAFEYFLRGELDRYDLTGLSMRWHEQAIGEPFDRGYIGKIQYYVDVPQNARGLWINQNDPILGDRNVRLGLAHALDFERILRTVFRGDYERLQQSLEGYYWGYTDPDIRARGFDLALADRYFDEAGWTGRDNTGIRTRDGQRLSVRISYATDEHTPWLVVAREEARKAGIELELQLLDPSTWSNQLAEKSFQIIYVAFGTTLTPNPWQSWHSDNADKPNTNNITNTKDSVLDELIDAFDDSTTLEERVELSHQIQERIHETASFIPAWKIPHIREAFWRWLKLPEHHATRISEEVFNPMVEGLMWIDEEARAETMEARQTGRTFPPINIVDTTWDTP